MPKYTPQVARPPRGAGKGLVISTKWEAFQDAFPMTKDASFTVVNLQPLTMDYVADATVNPVVSFDLGEAMVEGAQIAIRASIQDSVGSAFGLDLRVGSTAITRTFNTDGLINMTFAAGGDNTLVSFTVDDNTTTDSFTLTIEEISVVSTPSAIA